MARVFITGATGVVGTDLLTKLSSAATRWWRWRDRTPPRRRLRHGASESSVER